MHIVLIQHNKDRILDVSNADSTPGHGPSRGADEFQEIIERAMISTRRHDEDEGRYYREYRFMSFCQDDRKDGVDIFVCPHSGDSTSNTQLHDFVTVVTECFYIGYISCQQPAILIDFSDRSTMSDA
jgi:hypothetical protein